METEKDLTVKEVATALKRHPNTIRAMIKGKVLDAYMLGRDYRIPPASLEKLRENAA